MLRYAASLGCRTVSMAPYRMRPVVVSQMLPQPPLYRMALPQASQLALMWRAQPGTEPTEGEAEWFQSCIDRCLAMGHQAAGEELASSSGRHISSAVAESWRGESKVEDGKASIAPESSALKGFHCRTGLRGQLELVCGSKAGYEAVQRKVQRPPLGGWERQRMPGSVTYAWLNPADRDAKSMK